MTVSENTSGLEAAPKKKRGRPSKAELAERARLQAEAEAKAKAAEVQTAEDAEPVQLAEEADEHVSGEATGGKRKRIRRTKAEIIAAAEAAAQALAENNQKKADVEKIMQTEIDFAKEDKVEEIVPEAAFGVSAEGSNDENDDEPTLGLIERLQSKVQSQHGAKENAWETAAAEGKDFVVIQDLPVEDNGAIPYYDMFDNPNTSENQFVSYEEETDLASEFDFSDIIRANGLLEIMPDGYGFLRSSDYNYLSSPDDVHLTVQQIRNNFLKTGDVVECTVRPPHGNEKYFTMTTLLKVNGRDPKDIRDRISFENLTPLFPEEKFNLCGTPSATNISTRIVDLFSPIGKGQRSLIVSQPKTGKTILMKDIANAIAANHPEAYITMLLIDERPEEVTDMARTVNAEVIASTFDEPADRHVKIAGLVLEKAKRLVECGHDVVIFLDSITRLARAYNTVAPASGKVLTGGVDANALQKPKRFFGAARNIENGGSLTIIATALTDTGSKMDEVIFEEFKGTGNSELQLDRTLANKRIFPAVNLVASSTRRDDLLLDETTINRMWILRKSISDMNSVEAMQQVHNLMTRTHDNQEFLMAMNS